MQHAIKKQGGMASGENKPVTIPPGGIGWVVLEKILPQCVGHWCQRNRGAWVPRVGGLHRIHGEGTDGGNSLKSWIQGDFGGNANGGHGNSG